MPKTRKILAAVDLTIPPPKGSEEERKWRGVLYDDETYEFFQSDEEFEWYKLDETPMPVRLCLEYMLAWRALEEPDDYPLPDEI